MRFLTVTRGGGIALVVILLAALVVVDQVCSQQTVSCLSIHGENACRTAAECEWTGALCQNACHGYVTPASCSAISRCHWTAGSRCESQRAFCYRWDVEGVCMQYPTCAWDESTRSCLSTINEEETAGMDSSACTKVTTREACMSRNTTCLWNDTSCVDNKTSASTGTSEDDATAVPSRSPSLRPSMKPTGLDRTNSPTVSVPGYCNVASSREACEGSAIPGVRCVYEGAACRPVYGDLGPDPEESENLGIVAFSAPFYISFTFALAVAAIVLAYVVRTRSSLKPSSHDWTLRVLQMMACIAGLLLLCIPQPLSTEAVPIIVASFGIVVAGIHVLSSGRFPQWVQNAMDLACFTSSIIVSASISQTSDKVTFAAGVVISIVLLLVPWLSVCFFENPQTSHSTKPRSVWLIVPRAAAIAFAASALASSGSTITVAWVSYVVAMFLLVLATLTIILAGPEDFFVHRLVAESLGCILSIAGASQVNYEHTDLLTSVLSFAIVFAWSFGIGAGVLIVRRGAEAVGKLERKSSFSSKFIQRSPAKQKVFVTPAKTAQARPFSPNLAQPSQVEVSPRLPSGVYHETTARSRPTSADRSREESQKHRRSTSSGNYPREMAIV